MSAFLCGGGVYRDFGSCLDGDGLAAAFNAAAPLIRLTLLADVLAAPVMALLVFALNWSHKRAPRPASLQR